MEMRLGTVSARDTQRFPSGMEDIKPSDIITRKAPEMVDPLAGMNLKAAVSYRRIVSEKAVPRNNH